MQTLPESVEADKDFEQAMSFLQRAIARVVQLHVGEHASFEELERATLEVTNEASRRHLQARLQTIADRQPRTFRYNEFRYQPHQPGTVVYHSLCGGLEIRRSTYRRKGVRNGPTIVPLEIVAGIAERTTPAFSYCVAKGYAKTTMRDLREDLLAAHRRPPSRTTLERIATRFGTGVQQALDEIEPLVRMEEEVPAEACSISIGLDRTTVPMAEDRPPGAPPNSRRKRRCKPYIRKPPAPIDVNYRMAYVGTVSITNADGEKLQARQYAVPAHEGPADLVARVMADVHGALQQNPDLHVGVVLDAAPELWGLLRDALEAEPLVTKHYEAIDRYHLNERLAAGLRIIEPNSDERSKKLREWNLALDRRDGAIRRIERELWETYKTLEGAKRKQFEPCWDYVFGYSFRMRYAKLRKLGLPVGSGATEGACKSLVTARTKRSGQRWKDDGISGVLALRSIHQSGRFDSYWPRWLRWKTCADLAAA